MRRRAEPQDIEQKRLIISFPAVLQESALGCPSVADGFSPVLRPAPIGSAIERIGQCADLGFGLRVRIEKRRRGQRAGQQKRAVDGRQLALPGSPAGLHIQEVIVKAAISRGVRLRPMRAVPEEAQRCQSAFRGRAPAHESAYDAHRIAGQRKAGGGDACGPVCFRLVEDQAVGRVRFMDEVVECLPLQRLKVVLYRGVAHDVT